ncbi:hypothetical protein GCM10027176_68330 [Actinoallomurus bryophytorum]
MTGRGPWASMSLPTRMPARAETTAPVEKAAMAVAVDQPVSRVSDESITGKA